MSNPLIVQVKSVFVSLIEKTAKKYSVKSTDVKLRFFLRQMPTTFDFGCSYENNPVDVKDAGIAAIMFAKKISDVITNMLISLSDRNDIPKGSVNVVMYMTQHKELILVLLNGTDKEVRNISIDEILSLT